MLCRALPAIFYMAGAAAVIIWVSVHGSNITAVFICPLLLPVIYIFARKGSAGAFVFGVYMNKYIKSDLFRYYGKSDFITFIKALLVNASFRFQYAWRMRQSKGLLKYYGLILWFLNRNRKRIDLPVQTKVGYGLYIGHCGPVVVNPTAVIGNNVNLSQFTTIGSNHGKAAVIGDNVYIGPCVCVVEDIRIGDNVTIGAGSVVTKSIPDNATAVGNYAKVINYDNPGRYILNRWTDFN